MNLALTSGKVPSQYLSTLDASIKDGDGFFEHAGSVSRSVSSGTESDEFGNSNFLSA